MTKIHLSKSYLSFVEKLFVPCDKSYLSTIPKKSAFSKSLKVMKCFKFLICVFVKH